MLSCNTRQKAAAGRATPHVLSWSTSSYPVS